MFALFEQFTNFLWGMPLIIVTLVTGIYLTIRTGFFQFRHFGHIVKSIFSKERRSGGGEGDSKKALTPFQAISIAIGGTVGVSNMSGRGNSHRHRRSPALFSGCGLLLSWV